MSACSWNAQDQERPNTRTVSDNERIIQLESIVSHLEHQLDQLNGVVRELHTQIELLEQSQQQFADRLETLAEEPEERDPQQERPPHY